MGKPAKSVNHPCQMSQKVKLPPPHQPKPKPKPKRRRKFIIACSSLLGALGVVLAALLIRQLFGSFLQNSSSSSSFLQDCLPPSGRHLLQIARPRPAGSSGSRAVRAYIQSQFSAKYWSFEQDVHVAESTPAGRIAFTNLIFTSKTKGEGSNAKDKRRIVIAAHYDSKVLEAHDSSGLSQEQLKALIETSTFIGATDSAFACALMISLAQALESKVSSDPSCPFALQFVFFDGEEAMLHWSRSDSLYGSRHLAHKWAQAGQLTGIELMIVMDLLGASSSSISQQQQHHQQQQHQQLKFYSFNPPGHAIDSEFQLLKAIERSLSPATASSSSLFSDSHQYASVKGEIVIEDDHVPFLEHGVPVLHLIPIPFPTVWHTQQDDMNALDPATCLRTAETLLEYLKRKLKIK